MCRDLYFFAQKSKEYPEYAATFFFVLNGNLQGQEGLPAIDFGEKPMKDGMYFLLSDSPDKRADLGTSHGPYKTEQQAVAYFEDFVECDVMDRVHEKAANASEAVRKAIVLALKENTVLDDAACAKAASGLMDDSLWDLVMDNVKR
jgi:hypothetical protein